LFVNHLTTDEELHLGNGGDPIGDGVGLGTIRLDGHEVDIVEEVPLALEADGGHTIVRDVALNDLTLDSLGKICVTLVRRPEKADFGLTYKVHILGTDSNELGNTTRHFILYGDFIFKLRRICKIPGRLDTNDYFETRGLDIICTGLHSFKFFIEEIIDVPRERNIGFNFDLDTPNVTLFTDTHGYVHPHGEATLEDILCRGLRDVGSVVPLLLNPFFHYDIILTH
tara:strand:- start:362 stop:1039 length:678 start_codon:yes stop_codon:yes gene_type:complete